MQTNQYKRSAPYSAKQYLLDMFGK